jgi:hypothetical protein
MGEWIGFQKNTEALELDFAHRSYLLFQNTSSCSNIDFFSEIYANAPSYYCHP